MNETLALFRRLAIEQQKIIIVETLVLSDKNGHPDEVFSNVRSKHNPTILSTISRYWPSFAAVRLYVHKPRSQNLVIKNSGEEDLQKIEVKLLKSNQHRSGPDISCIVKIGNI